MEFNYISELKTTCFYVDLENKTYGVYINIKDIDRAQEIINRAKEKYKEQIEAWKNEWKEGIA